jgi:hypothetical protein
MVVLKHVLTPSEDLRSAPGKYPPSSLYLNNGCYQVMKRIAMSKSRQNKSASQIEVQYVQGYLP